MTRRRHNWVPAFGLVATVCAMSTLVVTDVLQWTSATAYASGPERRDRRDDRQDDRRDARDTRQEGREAAREAKQECKKADDKSNRECRKEKRDAKDDARDAARDIKRDKKFHGVSAFKLCGVGFTGVLRHGTPLKTIPPDCT